MNNPDRNPVEKDTARLVEEQAEPAFSFTDIKLLVKICIFMAVFMTVYEITKQFLFPEITLWQSHIATIAVSTILGGIAGWLYLRERRSMAARLVKEIAKRRMTEAELVDAGNNLEHSVEKRTAQLSRRNILLKELVVERERAEEELRENALFLENVFNAIQDGISVLDTDMRIVSRNKALMAMYGQGPMFGEHCWKVYHGRDTPCDNCPAKRSLLDGELHMEEVAHTVNGEEVGRLELFTYPFRDSVGRIRGVVEYVRDITRQKNLEKELTSALQRSEEAGKAKSVFLANMSHEIRTPLNAVLGYIQLMLGDEPAGRQKERLTVMHDSALALQGLINDVLDYSKIEAGKFDLRTEPFAPEELIRNLVAEQEVLAGDKGLDMNLRLHSGLPETVEGDPFRLRQLLRNLINNAVKYTDTGRIDVEVSCMPVPGRADKKNPPGERFLFVISDTGQGMADKDQDRIFDSFTQADSSLSKEHAGTGLGLAICKGIARLLGGVLWFDSEKGRGSSFYFSVVLPVAGTAPAEAKAIIDVPSRLPKDASPLNILLVEDNAVNQMFTEDLLINLGHSVTIAANGKEGLASLESIAFDLVLMDMQMPVMNGVEATRAVRNHDGSRFDPKIPIIGLSAFAMDRERKQFTAEGLDGYICKPVNVTEFLRTVTEVMDRGPA